MAVNIAIVFALAMAVYALPAGGKIADFVLTLIYAAFIASLAWFGYVLYRTRSNDIDVLSDGWRAALYAALAVFVLALVAMPRLVATSVGLIAWLAALVACALVAVAAYRQSRLY